MCMVTFYQAFTLTPAHLLTGNLNTVIPFNPDNCEDGNFCQKRDSAHELTEYWRKKTIESVLESMEM